MLAQDEFFGAPDRIALSRRSANLWRLLSDNPRFGYYGRLVALSEPGPDTADILSAMARLQGAAVCYYYPAGDAAALFAELEARGLKTDRHEHFRGGDAALAASREVERDFAFPPDLAIKVIDADTPREFVADVAELCQSCDVMPVPGSIMRGQVRTGICLAAIDRDGRVVATASSYMNHHPASSHATDAFWGMLATRQDRRGERIALLLGAKAIAHMWERHGARGFITGVRANNASSQALCIKLGVTSTNWIYAECMDKELFGGASLTK
jgi:Acetyltransferase (GNAT) family